MKKLIYLALLVSLVSTGAAAQGSAAAQSSPPATPEQARGEAYFNFTMGHYYAELYESTRRAEDATRAIEYYKKAYELDPGSSVIGESLAEIYLRAHRIRDAVLEAQGIIARDPNNLAARRLLARIYLRTLGDLSPSAAQRDTVARAIEQYEEILRIDPRDAEAAQWLARLYRLQNEHDKAEGALRHFLALEPENEGALELLVQLLLDEGRATEAIELVEKIVERSPTPALLDLLGDAYAQTNQPAKAEAAYRRAAEMDPRDPDHVRGLARALFNQGKLDEALIQYQQLAKLDPDDSEAYLRMSQIYRYQKKYDRAEESLLRARELSPGNVELIYQEAMLYEAQGRYEEAIRVLSGAIDALKSQGTRNPESSRALAVLYEQLGQLYREANNFQAALNTYQQMAQLGPEQEKRSRELTIETYRANKDIDRAISESEKAVQLYADDPSVKVSHALLLAEKGETDAAVGILKGMLKGAREDRGLYIALAQVYERGRRYADAETAARTAEGLFDTPAEKEGVWFVLGAIFERQKKYEQAEEYFKKVLEVNPHNSSVLNYYGYMLADRGVRLEEAVSLVQRALDEDPNNGAFLDSLGWAYFKENKYDLAEQYLGRALERDPDDPTIHDHIGDVYFKTGRMELAAASWERALTEWRRALPTEYEPERVAALEKKVTGLKHRVAQKGTSDAKPK